MQRSWNKSKLRLAPDAWSTQVLSETADIEQFVPKTDESVRLFLEENIPRMLCNNTESEKLETLERIASFSDDHVIRFDYFDSTWSTLESLLLKLSPKLSTVEGRDRLASMAGNEFTFDIILQCLYGASLSKILTPLQDVALQHLYWSKLEQ